MKIESSELTLGSQHQFSQKTVIKESLVEGISRPGERWSEESLHTGLVVKREQSSLHTTLNTTHIANDPLLYNRPSLTDRPLASLPVIENNLPLQIENVENSNLINDHSPTLDARMILMVSMIEIITGKKINIIEPAKINPDPVDIPVDEETIEKPAAGEYGMRYHYSEHTAESETSRFSADGKVVTSSGETIDINLQLTMSRSFVEHFQVDIAKGAARLKDPLVINFSDNHAELAEDKFQFDIDADGLKDTISSVSSGSGFLALDRNNDGEINNGKELFGALSGNGFAELALLDSDNNQFIDEADPVFSQLKVWVRDQQGNNELHSLAEVNIAAIYLESVESPFQLKDNNNTLQGVIRSTGIYLSEDGQVNTLQQLDIVV